MWEGSGKEGVGVGLGVPAVPGVTAKTPRRSRGVPAVVFSGAVEATSTPRVSCTRGSGAQPAAGPLHRDPGTQSLFIPLSPARRQVVSDRHGGRNSTVSRGRGLCRGVPFITLSNTATPALIGI